VKSPDSLSAAELCELADLRPRLLDTWRRRGFVAPDDRGRWGRPEATAVLALSDALWVLARAGDAQVYTRDELIERLSTKIARGVRMRLAEVDIELEGRSSASVTITARLDVASSRIEKVVAKRS
jgi:hypothetical protein